MYLVLIVNKKTEENDNQNRFFKSMFPYNSINEVIGMHIYDNIEDILVDISEGTIFKSVGLKDELISTRGTMELVTFSRSDNKADDFHFRFENGLAVLIGTLPPTENSLSNNEKEYQKKNQKLEIGDFVKIKSKDNNCKKDGRIKPGKICRIEEICISKNNVICYGIKPINNSTYKSCYYYLEEELEKGHIEWVKD